MKKIYLVRHGESLGNVGSFRQGPEAELTDEGANQAESVAGRFKDVKIDKIFSSPQLRAKMTADAIAKELNKEIIFSDLLIEKKVPSAIIGKQRTDPFVVDVDKQIRENIHNTGWKHSDEENFLDLKERAKKFFEMIESQEEESILVVTHGIFMRCLAAYVMFGESLNSQEYWRTYITLWMNNTGVTVFEQFKFENEKPRWNIITWNDHSHLSDIK